MTPRPGQEAATSSLAEPAARLDPLTSDLLGRPGSAIFSVSIGPHHVDRLLARAWGFRRDGDARVSLAIAPTATGQRWTRVIDGRRRSTTLRWEESDSTVVEQVGPLRMTFAAVVRRRSARLDLVRTDAVLGPLALRVPGWAVPHLIVCTRDSGSRLWAQVQVRSRRGRLMLAYEGTLP